MSSYSELAQKEDTKMRNAREKQPSEYPVTFFLIRKRSSPLNQNEKKKNLLVVVVAVAEEDMEVIML